MQEKEIEKKIIQRFNEFPHIFPEKINSYDFRVKAVLKFLGEPSDKKILDLGCGKGRFCRKIKDFGFTSIIGVDPSTELIRAARENNKDIKFTVASATNLPFRDNEFDFLICVEVLEQIPNTEKVIQEMARVLKPGGKVFVIDKNILSLHPSYFVPTFIWKNFLENRNKAFYPKDFTFKLKYFIPWKLSKIFKKYFSKTKVCFIRSEFINESQSLLLKNILKVHNIVSLIFYGIFTFLNLFITYEGTKQ